MRANVKADYSLVQLIVVRPAVARLDNCINSFAVSRTNIGGANAVLAADRREASTAKRCLDQRGHHSRRTVLAGKAWLQ